MKKLDLKNKIRNRSMLLKTFAGGCCLTLIILFLVAFFGIMFQRLQLIREYQDLTELTIENTDVVFNQYLTEIRNISRYWYSNADGIHCRRDTNYEIGRHVAFIKEMQQMMSNIPYIHSVFFFNQNVECVMEVGNSFAFPSLMGEKLSNMLINQDISEVPVLWNPGSDYSNQETNWILTFFYQLAPLESTHYEGTIAINLDISELNHSLFSDWDSEQVSIYIIDAYGNVVLSNAQIDSGDNWSQKLFVQKVLSGFKGHFTMREDGSMWEFSTTPSSVDGFFVAAKSDYGSIVTGIGQFGIMLVLILCAVLIVVIVLILFMCLSLYKPFYGIIFDLKQKENLEEEQSFETDVQFLRNIYQQMSYRVLTMSQQLKKEIFIKNLLNENRKADLQDFLLQNQIVSERYGYYMILLLLSEENGMQQANMEEYTSLQKMVNAIYGTRLEGIGKCTIFDLSIRRTLLIISEVEESLLSEEVLLEAIKGAQAISEEIKNNRIITVVSERITNGRESCLLIYRILNDSMHVQQLIGGRKEVIVRQTEVEMKYPEIIEKKVLHTLREQNEALYQEAVNEFIEQGQQCMYRTYISWLVNLSMEIVNQSHLLRREKPGSTEYLEDIRRQIEQIQDREELIAWFSSLYHQSVKQFEKMATGSAVSMMEQAMEYIETHYEDADMNIAMLANKLHISTAYCGKLFREFAGIGISEYLTKIRMEKAYVFLIEYPEKDIAQIGKMVGIMNPSYFASVFKMHYGMTPSKLRKFNIAQEIQEKM